MRTDHVIDLVSRIREQAHARITTALARRGHAGLVPSHGSILARLYEQGPQPMGALAQAIGRRKNTVTSLVRKLEAAGYARRLNDPTDSRISLVALTEKGQAFRADFEAISTALLATVWGGMATSRRESLVAGLEEILANLG
jgi:MarR family transcriptional regulator, organic hydroperoxide resistance regulator